MRIALVNQPWNEIVPPVQSGSIAIWNDQVARRLAQLGDQVTVYGRREGAAGAVETYAGVEYRRYRTRPDELAAKGLKRLPRRPNGTQIRRPPFSSNWYYRGYITQVARDLQRQPVDIVHIHNFSQFVPVVRRAAPRSKIVLHMHAEWLAQLDPALLAGRLAQANLILGCSDYLTGLARGAFPGIAYRCYSVFNGVDVDQFSPGEVPAGGPLKFLYVGRISPEKGLHVLLDAFREVVERYPDAQLEITGPDSVVPRDYLVGLSDDPLLADLQQYYALGDYPNWLRESAGRGVTFTGPVPYGELPNRYRQASVLVNPSFSETFGMSLIEGMACGLPVIATRVGGSKEVVLDGETGRLVEPADGAHLAKAMLEMIKIGPEKRKALGRAGLKRVLKNYSWQQVVDSLRQLYAEKEEEQESIVHPNVLGKIPEVESRRDS